MLMLLRLVVPPGGARGFWHRFTAPRRGRSRGRRWWRWCPCNWSCRAGRRGCFGWKQSPGDWCCSATNISCRSRSAKQVSPGGEGQVEGGRPPFSTQDYFVATLPFTPNLSLVMARNGCARSCWWPRWACWRSPARRQRLVRISGKSRYNDFGHASLPPQ